MTVPGFTELKTMSQLIPAAPGWRIVFADRENQGSVALPIVAWEPRSEEHQVAPPSSPADPPRTYTLEYLRAWYVPHEQGVPPLPLLGPSSRLWLPRPWPGMGATLGRDRERSTQVRA